MSHHPATSRPKPAPPGNEEASATLNLGEFEDVDTLTLSEAALVINALVAKRRNDRKNVNETEYVVHSPGSCHFVVEQLPDLDIGSA
jgi:DNA-directed RNA polymerase II subunit RPB4